MHQYINPMNSKFVDKYFSTLANGNFETKRTMKKIFEEVTTGNFNGKMIILLGSGRDGRTTFIRFLKEWAQINGHKSRYYDFRYRSLPFDKFAHELSFSFLPYEPVVSAYENPSSWNTKIILELNHMSDPLANLIEAHPDDFVVIKFTNRISDPLVSGDLLDELIEFMRDHHSY